MNLDIPYADFALPILEPARYKGIWGGRGSGKSHTFASLMVEEHLYHRSLRSVCIREVQKSLKDSSKLLLSDKLRKFGLLRPGQGFKIYNELIQTPGDGQITFAGMNDQTAESIKSLENYDRSWFEEAQTMTANSLELLGPTIRARNSEKWFSWNPRRKTDAVDRLLRGLILPTGAIVLKANWNDNPWFTPELEQERLDCLRINPDQYEHIWNGDYVTIVSGAYYANCLTEAKAEGRLGRLSRDPLMTIRSFWDIGGTGARADACSIWIAQFIGKEIRILDYYEAVGQPLATHVNWLRDNGYEKAQIVLPHDGVNHDKVYSVTYESALQDAGFDVFVVQNQGAGAAKQRIEAARRLFPAMWFNQEKCQGGISAIGWYHSKKDEARGIDLGPDHDWSSHSCFLADTKIRTSKGGVEIQNIRVGDYVDTPCGYARVDNSGMTKISTELIEITLANGMSITCTPEHKLFSDKGIIYADSLGHNNTLGYNDTLLTIKDKSCIQLANASKMGYRDAFIENTKALGIGIGKNEKCTVHRSIIHSLFCIGLLQAAKQANKKFFHWTETWKILALKIGQYAQRIREEIPPQSIPCSYSMGLNSTGDLTMGITQENILRLNLCPGMFGSFTTALFQKVTKYTTRTKTKKTTQSKIFNLSKMESIKNCMQRQVLGLGVKKTKNNLLKQAKGLGFGTQAQKVLNGTGKTESKVLRKGSQLKQPAQYVENLIKQYFQRDPYIAGRIVKLRRYTEEVPVYDLTVNKHHCYYANGILVSNSDAFGLMAVAHPLLMDNPQNHRPIDYSRHNLGIV